MFCANNRDYSVLFSRTPTYPLLCNLVFYPLALGCSPRPQSPEVLDTGKAGSCFAVEFCERYIKHGTCISRKNILEGLLQLFWMKSSFHATFSTVILCSVVGSRLKFMSFTFINELLFPWSHAFIDGYPSIRGTPMI